MSTPYAKATLMDEEEVATRFANAENGSSHYRNGTNNGTTTAEVELQPLSSSDEQYHSLPSVNEIKLQKYTTWNDWFFPPDVPRECQLLRRENIAIPACYLLVGLLQGLSGPLINVYPLDLGATEAQQTTLSSIRSLPASFKLLFGFWSDNVPLGGYRRKSYMMIGWLVSSLSLLGLIMGSDLSDASEQVPQGAPSIPFLSVTLLGFGIGFWFADVMGDSVVAEKAKLEISKGHLQSTCYACRFFGLMVAAPCSSVIYSKLGAYYVFTLMAIMPLSILPLVYNLAEARNAPVASTREQCGEIWNTVCSRAVWQPMGFVYLYNLLQVPNAAWREFLKTSLGFTSNMLNAMLISAYVLLYLGILAYKYYFIKWSWRAVYIGTTLLNGILSALQILLIKGITFGLSPFLFALGDDAMAELIAGIQFLPTTIMMVHLCPSTCVLVKMLYCLLCSLLFCSTATDSDTIFLVR